MNIGQDFESIQIKNQSLLNNCSSLTIQKIFDEYFILSSNPKGQILSLNNAGIQNSGIELQYQDDFLCNKQIYQKGDCYIIMGFKHIHVL